METENAQRAIGWSGGYLEWRPAAISLYVPLYSMRQHWESLGGISGVYNFRLDVGTEVNNVADVFTLEVE